MKIRCVRNINQKKKKKKKNWREDDRKKPEGCLRVSIYCSKNFSFQNSQILIFFIFPFFICPKIFEELFDHVHLILQISFLETLENSPLFVT